ncbi:MAG: hypothetical protein JNM56_26915 [Planctomycetia bacterium]|nr:hypothetical protein [Planctomycetia bacterium]
MAWKPRKPSSESATPTALPQRKDVWQFDTRQARAEVRIGDRSVRPWLTFVVNSTAAEVVGFDMGHEEPTLADAERILLKAMTEPAAGKPHRPKRVQVRRADWAAGLRAALQPQDVEIVVSATLADVDEAFAQMTHDFAVAQESTGLLDVPGVTAAAVAGLFDAAASFYEQAPWRTVGERPIRIACSRFDSSPWFATLLGQGGMARGLVLYDQLETLLRIQQGDLSEEENARLTAGLAVIFSGKEDLLLKDVEAATHHRWRVVALDAFPVVYRMEPGLSMRPPLAWEVQVLEGCLRAIPEFLRKKTRRLAPLELSVPTANGELPLVLSWAVE